MRINYPLRAACMSMLFVLISIVSFAQSNGIYESYAILSLNGGANAFYDMQATTGNPDFQGAALGSFSSAQSLVVKGGQNKTFKCDGGDIFNGHLNWRVWLTSAGASGSFTTVTMSFVSNDGGGCGGNQTWEGTGGATNIISGLSVPGNYTLEVYSDADGIPGTVFSSNGGANYKATFNYCGPTSGALPVGNYAIPGCFATIAAAVTYINTNGVSGTGTVQFDVAAGGSETAPAGGISITATGTATTLIKFVKGAGAAYTITASGALTSGALNDAIIKIIGGDYITLDGLTLQENAANLTTAAGTNNMTEWGVALLYATATDGAQNCTIQNCTITLNRTYQNTFGIYSNSTHTATSVTTSATATGAAGGNSGLKIYGNNISNVNMGIVVVGPTAAADANTGIDIGGTGGGQANIITNFGTTGTFSSYANVSGTVNGILVRNSNGFNVSFNTVTSSVGGTTAGTLNGIQIPAASNTPTGTFTNTINSNNISLQSAAASGAINGINYPSGSASTTSTLNINSNNFNTFGHTVGSATGAIAFISDASTNQFTTINSNTFTNISVNTSGTVNLISQSFTAPSTGTKAANNNSIVTGFTRTGASGSVVLLTDNGSTVTGAVSNCQNNNFSNVTVSGTTTIIGLNYTDGGTAPTRTVTGNTLSNWVCGTGTVNVMNFSYWNGTTSSLSSNTITNITGQGAITGITIGSSVNTANPATISSNTISNLTSTGTGGNVIGITSSNSSTIVNINNNTINTLSSTASVIVTGINITGGTTVNIFKNKIYDVSASGTGNCAVYGMFVSGGTTINTSNNLIGDIRVTAGNNSNGTPMSGIFITGGTTHNIYYNTVYLGPTSTTGTILYTAAIFTNLTPTSVNLRNNIFVNLSTPVGTGPVATAFMRSSTSLTNYAATSNNNFFYAGIASATRLIYFDNTNSDQTIGAFKTRVSPRDNASVSEIPTFQSTSGSSADFLKYSISVATQIESGAAPIAGFTDDYIGTTRNVTTPDMGAWELNGIAADFTAPSISYTPLSNGCGGGSRTLVATITDASGVPTSGPGLPVLYFKINAGGYTASTGSFVSGNTYNFSVGSGSVNGDVVSYYVVAQDNAGTPNVGAFPSAGASGFTANPPAASTPPTTPSSYTNIATLAAGTYTVGSGGTYGTLTAAVADFNAKCVSGAVVFSLTDATYPSETFPITLNANSGSSSINTLTIKPASGVTATISGSSANAIIKLNGADFITIDGSNNGSSSRDLTISNTNSAAATGVIWVSSLGTGAGCTDNTIKNCNISCGADQSTGALETFAIISSGTSLATGNDGVDNNNLVIQNNNITKSRWGIFVRGGAASSNTGLSILNNIVGPSAFGANSIGKAGIIIQHQTSATVTGNEVRFVGGTFSLTSAGADRVGIGVGATDGPSATATNILTSTVARNNIHDIVDERTFSSFGILVASSSTPSSNVIANNFINNVHANGTSGDQGISLAISAGNGDKIVYNTINMVSADVDPAGATTASESNMGIRVVSTSSTNLTLADNIIYADLAGTTTTLRNFAIVVSATSYSWGTGFCNYNDYYVNGSNAQMSLGGIGTTGTITPVTTLASWKTQFTPNQDGSSQNIQPVFTSATDLHLPPASNVSLDNLGTPIAGVTTDYDGDTRNLSTPDMGADEFVVAACATAIGGTTSGTATICSGTGATVTASGYSSGTGSNYQWEYSSDNFVSDIHDLNGQTNPVSASTGNLSASTYFRLRVSCATNSSTDYSTPNILITVNPVPSSSISPSGPITTCSVGTQVLTANTSGGSPTYQWVLNGSNISGATASTYTPVASGSYTVIVTSGGCSATSAAVSVTVNQTPSTVTVTPSSVTVCSTDPPTTLTASGGTVGGNGSATLGTASTLTGATTQPTAFCNRWAQYWNQTIYTAAELTAAGFTAGANIISVTYTTTTQGDANNNTNFSISIGNTGSTTLSTFQTTGFTTVFGPTSYTHVIGTNLITFDSPFTWDGSSNIILDVRQDGVDAINNAITFFTAASDNKNIEAHTSTTSGTTPLQTLVANATVIPTASTTRLNVVFGINTLVNPTWTWAPGASLNTTTGATVSASPTTTTTYTATATVNGCSSNGTSTITVNPSVTYYQDFDTDNYGNPAVSQASCTGAPVGYVADNTDCNDANAAVNPGATEVCNLIDDDCDTQIDEGVQLTFYADADIDGFGDPSVSTMACTAPSGYVSDNTDCNDADNTVHSMQTYYADTDLDGFGDPANFTTVCSSTPPAGYVSDNSDCDDTQLLYTDGDNDTYGAGAPVACGVANNTDCNDANAAIYPGATEICGNGLDDDCDTFVDDGCTTFTYYADVDGDGFGDAANDTTTTDNTPPSGYVTNSLDCDDTQLLYADADADTYGAGAPVACGVANNTDCNDGNAAINPGATEVCNSIDDDCDTLIDEGLTYTLYYVDADNDTYGSTTDPGTLFCANPGVGYSVNNTDCNDANAAVNPGANEICNSIDDDCDGNIDNVASPTASFTASCNPMLPGNSSLLTSTSTAGSGTITSYQWNLNGLAISGATNSTYTTGVNANGDYTLTVTNSNSCSNTSPITTLTNQTGALAGTYSIPSSCGFATIASAVNYINTNGLSGSVVFNVSAGYTETAPTGGIVINQCALATGLRSSATQTVTFQKSGGGANPKINAYAGTSTTVDGIVKIVGADYITFDAIDVSEAAGNVTATTQMEWGYALLKCDGNNGSNNNTIKNCVITMTKVNTASVGLYSGNHIATSTTGLTYSGLANDDAQVDASRNGRNTFFGNTISNVYTGISLNGNAAASGSKSLNDTLNQVGAIAQAVNAISNFGGLATAVNGIIETNQRGLSIDNNTINGGTGSTGTVTGISMISGVWGNVRNNVVTLASAATTSTMTGITVGFSGGSATNPNLINITGNIIQNISYTTATTAAFTGINCTAGGTSAQISISNNTVQNNTVAGTGTITCITSTSGPSGGTVNINSNVVSGNNASNVSTTTHTMALITNSGAPATLSMSSNTINGNTHSGVGTMNGLVSTGAPTNFSMNNNTITNNTIVGGAATCTLTSSQSTTAIYTYTGNTIRNNGVSTMTGTSTATVVGYTNSGSPTSETLTGNSIRRLYVTGVSTGTHTVRGILNNTLSTTTRIVTSNQIDSLYSTGSATITGITSNAGGTVLYSKNRIFNLIGNGANSIVTGVLVTTGTQVGVYNNYIGDLLTPAATGANAVIGISNTGSLALGLYFNTIRLSGSGGATFGSSGVSVTTTNGFEMRNNIIDNLCTPGSTSGNAVAYRRSTTGFTGYTTASNNNMFYAGTPASNHLIYFDGTNSSQTLSAYQALAATRDQASVTENVSFASITPGTTNYLHVDATVATQTESGAVNVTGITDDYDGDIRQGNAGYSGTGTAPDIGGDEFNGILLDITAPFITYTPVSGACAADVKLTATISDASGVPTSGGFVPRIYYKKNSGSYFSQPGTLVTGTANNGSWSFTIVSADFGGASGSDVISYFVIAQDVASTPNVGSNPGSGLVASDVNTVTTPPTTPNTFSPAATSNITATATATPSSVCNGATSSLTSSATAPTTTTVNNYVFSAGTGASLDPMTGSTTVIGTSDDDTPTGAPASFGGGFTFNYDGVNYTQYSVSPDGWILMGGATAVNSFTNNPSNISSNIPKIYPYWDDLATGTTGNVQVLLTGSAPNRIFIVQWFVTIPRNTGGTANSTFQCWLYEASNKIEFRYGTMGINTTDVSVGLRGSSVANFQSVTISSNTASNSVANDAQIATPASGTMYTFNIPNLAVPGASFSWDPSADVVSPNSQNTNTVALSSTTTYTVTVTNPATGCTATANALVTVGAPLTATVNSPAICNGQSTNLTATPAGGGAPFTYTWAPATGLSATTGQTVSANPSTTTTYTATVLDNCGSSTNATGTVTVNPLPTLTVSPGSGLICGTGSVALTASGSSTSYTWAPATGLNATTGASVTASPTITTTYTVTGSDGTCSATFPVTISVGPAVTATASATPSSVCNGGSSQLQATASQPVSLGNSYSLSSLTGQTYSTLSGGGITVINTSAQLTAGMGSGAQDDGGVVITLPFTFSYAGNTFTQMSMCTNGWVGAGNWGTIDAVTMRAAANLFTSTIPNNTIAAWFKDMGANFPTGTGSMRHGLIGTDVYAFQWNNAVGSGFSDGSAILISFQINIYGPASTAPGRIEIIYGPTVGAIAFAASEGIEDATGGTNHYINALTGNGTSTTTSTVWPGNGNGYRFDTTPSSLTYSWSPATFLDNTAISNPNATGITATTTYTVTVTGIAGCTTTATATVSTDPLLVSVNSPTICSGQSATLTASTTGGGFPFTYLWSPGSETTSSITVSPTSTTTYSVTVMDACGSSVSANGTVTVNASPVVSVTPTPSTAGICGSGSVTLTAAGDADSYSWAPSSGLNVTTGTTVIASPTATTDYVVTGTALNGCTTTATQTVYYVPSITLVASATPASVCSNATSQLNAVASVPITGGYALSSIPFAPVVPSGATVPGPTGDDVTMSAVPIGFNFSFFGNPYSTVTISTNGFISFDAVPGAGCCTGQLLPNSTAPNNLIAAAWEDLNTAVGGNIDYFTQGIAPNRVFVVRYNAMGHHSTTGSGDPVTTQIVLYESTNIAEVHTASMPQNPNGTLWNPHTQGIENSGGTVAVADPARNSTTTWFLTNDAVRFAPVGPITFTYAWSPSSFLNNPNIQNPVASNVTTTTLYTVTATSTGGCTQTTTVNLTSVTVPTDPIANDSTQCGFGVPTCTVTSTSGLSSPTFHWYLTSTGGTPLAGESGNQLTAYTINSTTTFYVSEFTGVCESNRVAVVETVTQPDQVSAGVSPSPICTGASTTLTATQTGSTNTYVYTWTASPSVGSGITGSVSGQSVIITPTAAGTYTYTVTAVDASAGCTTLGFVTLTVNPLPVITTVSATPSSVCTGGVVTLAVSSLGTGPQTLPATYCVPVQTGTSCVSSVVLNTLNSTPPACVSPFYHINPYSGNETTTVTAGQTYSMSLTTTGLSIISVWIDYDRSGTFDVSEWVQPWTAASSGSVNITVPSNALAGATGMRIRSRLNGNINGAVDACNTTFGSGSTEDYTVNIVAGVVDPNVSYVWNPGNVSGATVNVTPPTGTTTYTVTATNSVTGCFSTGTTTVTSGTALVVSVNSDTVCSGLSTTLTAAVSGGGFPYTYLWSPGGATTPSVTVAPSSTTTYSVTVTDNCANSTLATGTVSVNPLPTVTVTPDNSTICPGGSGVLLTASGANTYSWSPATGLSLTTGAVVTATPVTTTTYVVTGTDANGCVNTASASVNLSPAMSITVTATPDSICAGGSSSLNASVAAATSPATSYSLSNLSGQTYSALSGGGITVINTTGQLTAGMGSGAQDDGGVVITLPFTFTYLGNTFSQMSMCTNGWVGAGNWGTIDAVSMRAAGNLFTSTIPNNTIAAWFKDMGGNFPTGTGSMRHGLIGTDVYAFQWDNAVGSGFTDGSAILISFQINIYGPASVAPGRIEIIYGPTVGAIAFAASEGIEDATGGTDHYLNALTGTGTSTITSTAWPGNGNGYRFNPIPATGLTYSWSPATYLNDNTISNPVASGVASTTAYTVTATNGAGCTTSGSVTVSVVSTDPTFTGLDPDYCADAGAVLLTPVQPGGVFSGTGVILFGTDYYFDPSTSGVGGPFAITYTTMCASSSQNTSVHSLPVVTIDSFPAICVDAGPLLLTGGSPAGGFYFDFDGFVDGTYFYPAAAGTGPHTIYYAYSDPFGCSSLGQQDIIVDPVATVLAGPDQTICALDDASLSGSFGGSASGATWTTSGDGTFANASNPVTTYSPGLTDQLNGFVTLTLTTNDPAGACGAVSDALVVTLSAAATYYADVDGDGYGAGVPILACGQPAGTSTNNTDCNDNNAAVNPGATDVCNGVDDNCDGQTDENPLVVTVTPSGTVSYCKQIPVTLTGDTEGGLTYQWYKNNVLQAGATNSTYITTKKGDFKVVESNGFCTGISPVTTIARLTTPRAFIGVFGNLDICSAGSVLLRANKAQPSDHAYQWNKGGLPIVGATDRLFTATSTGDYTVTVSNINGCANTSDVITVTSSCKEAQPALFSAELTLYPNPNHGDFVVELHFSDDVNSEADVQVINTIGQTVYLNRTAVVNGELFDEVKFSYDVAAGNYFVRVIVGDKVYTGQIIYQK